MAWAQQDGAAAGKIDDGRLDADLAWSAFEYEIDVLAEVRAHVRRSGGRYLAETIGGRRRDRAVELLQQLMRDGVRRHAQAYGRSALR